MAKELQKAEKNMNLKEQAEESQSVIAALTADYLNVYVVEPEKNMGTIIKLDGYVIRGIKEKPKNFIYSDVLQTYAKDRVCQEDQEEFLKTALPDALIRSFSDGREKLEFNYRVSIEDRLEHFSGLYSRISKPGEPLKLIIGFRNTENIISIQKKTRNEGLYSAYEAVSDLYLAMFRVNIKDNTYASIKTTDAILKYTPANSNKFDENIRAIIAGLAKEESVSSALEFLNLATIQERMREKKHIVTQFEGKLVGSTRLHLIKEDEDAVGNVKHVILAVEVLEDDTYQSAFDVLARGFQNVFILDRENATARILKMESFISQGLAEERHTAFDYSKILQGYIEKRVHPDDRKMLYEKICIEHLREVFAKQDEYVGNYRVLVEDEVHNYQYNFSKPSGSSHIVCGFQNIDSIIEAHMEADRKEREKEAAQQKRERALEEAHLREVKEHAEVITSLSTIYSTIFRAEIDTHQYEVLNSVALMGEIAGGNGNFDDVKERIVDAFISTEMKEQMREFLDLDTLADRLQQVNTVAAEYKNPEGRWLQARFIVKRRDKFKRAKEVLYVARDCTDEKEKELKQQEELSRALAAAQQANKAKSTFLNSMSHDIRTPMNAIIGFTALAQTHIEDQIQVQDYLAKISTSSTHLLSLINDILDMSRIESGTVKLDEKPVHIPDLLHDLRTMIQGLVNSKNLNLYIDTQDVMNEDVITDKLRLNQVLINIVGNAIKFTQPGGDIIIRLLEKPCRIKHYTTYEFSVKDNGIGMSKEFLGHIFDTFSREYSTTVSGIQGTGLGMAITKNIVDMMGGEIQVESEEGKGSMFTVILNLRLANEPIKNEPIPELLGARALVVDDDLNTCRSVSKMLRNIHMRPDWTASGKEAIIRAQDAAEMKDEYKVYIIDYLMPDMNGIETVRQIRKVISEEVPIIVLTAYDWSDFEHEAREAGVTAFVSKPIFMSELKAVLTQPVIQESMLPKEKKEKHYDYSGKSILLVEDNELNREIAMAILEETGMTIECTADGDEAVAIISKAPADRYDLILMDIQMPKMDGYMATREIRTLPDNKKANIPIVAMTANAFEEDKEKAYESGMNGHIIKPISMEEIAKVLDQIFEKRNK